MELADLKKTLKPLGFKIKTRRMSHGVHATVTDSTGSSIPSIFTTDTLAYWKPAIEVCRSASPVTADGEKVYGLAFK